MKFRKLKEWIEILPKNIYVFLSTYGEWYKTSDLIVLLRNNDISEEEMNSDVCNVKFTYYGEKAVIIDLAYAKYYKGSENSEKRDLWEKLYLTDENAKRMEDLYIEKAVEAGKYVKSTIKMKIDLEKECKKYVYTRHDLPNTVKEHKIKSLYYFHKYESIYDENGDIVMTNIINEMKFNEFCVAFDRAVVLLCDGLYGLK